MPIRRRSAAGPLFDFLAFGGGALVVPEQGAADDAVALIEEDRAMHLARQADRFDVGGFELALLDDGADGFDDGLPPIFGILFAPERFGVIDRIFGGCLGEDFSAPSMASVLVPEVPMSMPRKMLMLAPPV